MKRIGVYYRDHDRTPLLYLIREMAARFEDLEVPIEWVPGHVEYTEGFLSGKLDLICEHLQFLFPARAQGHPIRCLAACQNRSVEEMLAAKGVETVRDLRGKTVAIRSISSSRMTALQWLRYLGLEESVRVLEVSDEEVGRWAQWRRITEGVADAVICSPLYREPALAAGLHVVEAPPLPQVGSLYFAALGPFVDEHDDELRSFTRALYRALHAFHHDPKLTLKVMSGEPARLMGISDQAELRRSYEFMRDSYEERPLPRLDALAQTYDMLRRHVGGIDGLNPLMLWDLRYVLELEEQGFMRLSS